ncbi:MAG: putative phage tail protein [Pseudomonadota bacterium]
MFDRTGDNRITKIASVNDGNDVIINTADALSNPTVEALTVQNIGHLPVGAAWGTPDGSALPLTDFWASVVRGLSAPWAYLYRRGYQMTLEMRLLTLNETLPDWEADFGLPDDCGPLPEGISARITALVAKVRNAGVITPTDYITVANDLGYTVEIEEVYSFECGFSQCGGDHETGDVQQEAFWIVHVIGLAVSYFRAAESEVSVDPLFSLPGIDPLRCQFEKLAPGWTLPVFSYEGDVS